MLDINKHVRPHGLRYFFNDILRLTGVDPVSARSLTGHVTEEMRAHHSTVRLDEKRRVMDRVVEHLRAAKVDQVDFSVDLDTANEKAAIPEKENAA